MAVEKSVLEHAEHPVLRSRKPGPVADMPPAAQLVRTDLRCLIRFTRRGGSLGGIGCLQVRLRFFIP
jgi:hypothetical protein